MHLQPPPADWEDALLDSLIYRIQRYAGPQGYAVVKGRTKKFKKTKLDRRAWIRCDRGGKPEKNSQRARLGQAYGGGRGGAGAPPSQPARQRPQSDRIRAAATAALSLTRGGRARGNESKVNIYGDYGVAYGGAYDPDAW